ncbi:MAG: nitronate monooxygenase [Gammaproteobacteria bacterium]|nr:nitronate monooxygenase [Gammaproteobacteria bacterium]
MDSNAPIQSAFPRLKIRDFSLLPVVQGGMGVGISGHRLAGSVAREGAVGTIASVELRRLHPDLMERAGKSRDHGAIAATNLEALDREVQAAREIAGPGGFIAVNVMRAVKHYADLVRQACRSGANAIVMGAGLPMDLPELAEGHGDVALIPILSEERGVRAVLKKWMRKGVLPDAIVLEHPRYAGGHLGATRIEEVNDPRFDFSRVLDAVRDVFKTLGLATDRIPLIPGGGINAFERVKELFAWGASAVQVGTPFAVTRESDAHINFKRVLAEAGPEDIVTFMSAAGLPARAVLTPWLKRYLAREKDLRARAKPDRSHCGRQVECLNFCGLKDGDGAAGQFCIETQLAAAQRGDVNLGLFFRGSESLPFGREIRSVHELLTYLLSGVRPTAPAAAA